MVVHGMFQACFHNVIGMIRSTGGASFNVFADQRESIVMISPILSAKMISSLEVVFSDSPKTLEVQSFFFMANNRLNTHSDYPRDRVSSTLWHWQKISSAVSMRLL